MCLIAGVGVASANVIVIFNVVMVMIDFVKVTTVVIVSVDFSQIW